MRSSQPSSTPQPPDSKRTAAAARPGLSPNQLAKRDQIVAAAVAVLLRDGVHACTVRSIATQAGIAKGAVHYYFEDIDELVDRAMLAAIEGWIAWLRHVAGTPTNRNHSKSAFWRAVTASMEPFAQGDRTLMPLWLEYWAICTRAGRPEPLRALNDLLSSFVAELLDAAGATDPLRRAVAVGSYLLGQGMQGTTTPVPTEELLRHVSALAGLPTPRQTGHVTKEMGHSPKTAGAGRKAR